MEVGTFYIQANQFLSSYGKYNELVAKAVEWNQKCSKENLANPSKPPHKHPDGSTVTKYENPERILNKNCEEGVRIIIQYLYHLPAMTKEARQKIADILNTNRRGETISKENGVNKSGKRKSKSNTDQSFCQTWIDSVFPDADKKIEDIIEWHNDLFYRGVSARTATGKKRSRKHIDKCSFKNTTPRIKYILEYIADSDCFDFKIKKIGNNLFVDFLNKRTLQNGYTKKQKT